MYPLSEAGLWLAVTIIPTSAFNLFIAKASTGVGRGLGNTYVVRPAPANISALSFAKSSDPYLASRPITTEFKSCFFMNFAIAVAVLLTTALFMQEGPGPIGPLKPAVPNFRKPEKHFSKAELSLSDNIFSNCIAVDLSGSCLIQSSTSIRS